MKFLEGKSKREKVLLIGLIASLFFGSYLTLRVKSLNQDLKATEAKIKTQKEKYAKLVRQTDGVRPSTTIRKEVSVMQKKLDAEKQNLKGLDISFVDLSNQEALHALIADITLVAEKNHLQVLSKLTEVSDLAKLVGTAEITRVNNQNTITSKKNPPPGNNSAAINISRTVSNNETLKRHVYKLQVRGSFVSTYQFIRQLKTLKHGVLIARLKLQADDENTYNGRRLITTDLTLAI